MGSHGDLALHGLLGEDGLKPAPGSAEYQFICLLLKKNGKHSGLQKFAMIQLQAASPALMEGGAGRKGASTGNKRGEEATGIEPAAGQHLFSGQLLSGCTSPFL